MDSQIAEEVVETDLEHLSQVLGKDKPFLFNPFVTRLALDYPSGQKAKEGLARLGFDSEIQGVVRRLCRLRLDYPQVWADAISQSRVATAWRYGAPGGLSALFPTLAPAEALAFGWAGRDGHKIDCMPPLMRDVLDFGSDDGIWLPHDEGPAHEPRSTPWHEIVPLPDEDWHDFKAMRHLTRCRHEMVDSILYSADGGTSGGLCPNDTETRPTLPWTVFWRQGLRWRSAWAAVRVDEHIVLPRRVFSLEIAPPGAELCGEAGWTELIGYMDLYAGSIESALPCGDSELWLAHYEYVNDDSVLRVVVRYQADAFMADFARTEYTLDAEEMDRLPPCQLMRWPDQVDDPDVIDDALFRWSEVGRHLVEATSDPDMSENPVARQARLLERLTNKPEIRLLRLLTGDLLTDHPVSFIDRLLADD